MAASATPSTSDAPRRHLQGPLLVVAALLAALWFTFFDSHSLVKRIRWHQEAARLTEENEALRREIEILEERLAEPLSDEVIEKIAREEYGMRRPGETVYRVEQKP
jgi:cell division protein FtsB